MLVRAPGGAPYGIFFLHIKIIDIYSISMSYVYQIALFCRLTQVIK